MRNRGNLFLVLLVSVLIGVIDCFFGRDLLEQYASKNFPSTTGWIIHSEVTSHNHWVNSGTHGGGRQQTAYDADVRYHYEVGGQTYEGKRFRYTHLSSAAWAQNVVTTHPVGSQTQVFYNPNDPQDSLLSPGFERGDFYCALILTPFNLIMLFLWYWTGRQFSKVSNS
jgi:hypothetical protein